MDNSNTPRSRRRNEIREKRLAYYDVPPANSADSPHRSIANPEYSDNPNGASLDLRLNVREMVNMESKEVFEDNSGDTSRTSDILMETARDYRTIMKERQERQGKQAEIPRASKSEVNLCDSSVAEVLKLVGQHSEQRRKTFQRIQDLSDSDEFSGEENGVAAKRESEKQWKLQEEKDRKWGKEERQTIEESKFGEKHLVNEDDSQTPLDGEISFECSSSANKGSLSAVNDQYGDIGRAPWNNFTENLSDGKDYATLSASNHIHAPQISFSAQEIYTQAEKMTENSNEWLTRLSNVNQSITANTAAAVPERSRSPVRRSVRFDCPASPAESDPNASGEVAPSRVSQSLDARSSVSGMSYMSIGNMAQRLQELGINPKLIGIDVPDPTSRGKGMGRRLVKICPTCGKCNAENLSWCLSCASVLVGLQPQPLPRKKLRVSTAESLDSNDVEDEDDEDEDEDEEEDEDDEDVEEEEKETGEDSPLESVVASSFTATSVTTDVNGEGAENPPQVEKLFDSWEGNEMTDAEETEVQQLSSALETPNSVYDDEVTPLTSPMVPLTPVAVWDPNKVDVATLIQQSRALVDQSVEISSEAEENSTFSAEPSISPRPVSTRSNHRASVVMQSTDTTFSSMSLVTPSIVGESHLSPQLAQDLHLDLISSSLEEPSDKTVSNQPEDIAVLDRADVLAMRRNSTASAKPDEVPQLPLSWSPTSTDRSVRGTLPSADDLKVDDILYQDPDYNPMDNSTRSLSSNAPPSQGPPSWRESCPRGGGFGFGGRGRGGGGGRRWGGSRPRPNSATAAMPLQNQTSTPPGQSRRRPASSDQAGGGFYQRRWKNSSTAWANHHPSLLKKKPAAVVVRESLEAAKGREMRTPNSYPRLQEDGSSRRSNSSQHRPGGDSGRGHRQSRGPDLGARDDQWFEERTPRRPHSRSNQNSASNSSNSSGPQRSDESGRKYKHQEDGVARRPLSGSHRAWGDNRKPQKQERVPEHVVQNDRIDTASSPIDFVNLASNNGSTRREKKEPDEIPNMLFLAEAGKPIALMPDTVQYLEQRGWNVAENSPWLYLADEIWLHILRFLSIEDLTSLSASCRRLHCVANDKSLWRHITVKRRHVITRENMLKIGACCPVSLKMRQCRAPDVTVQDASVLLDMCGPSLRKLSFNGCNQGAFSEDQFILLAALYCPHLTTVDVSYANGVRDSTVRALAESCVSLECVKLNGAQKISDEAIQCLITFHADNLRTLELYCCFGVSSNSVRDLGKKCPNLSRVCFGTCMRVSSNALVNFAGHRREKLLHLDLRGLPTVLDSTIASIVAVCPKLESVALANCCSISNVSIRALANSCTGLRKLDVCGCNQVGSDSAQDLVRRCKFLEEVDFSSTCVDHRTVTCLARTYVTRLKTLRLNFCCNLKEDGLSRLCESTKSLKSLLLFGVRNVSPAFILKLRLKHPGISIKSDDSVENLDQ